MKANYKSFAEFDPTQVVDKEDTKLIKACKTKIKESNILHK